MYHEDINRHTMKSSYQPHMIKAVLIATILVSGSVLILASLPALPPPKHPIFINNAYVDESTPRTPTEATIARRNIPQAPLDKAFHGQYGINIKIIPDYPEIANIKKEGEKEPAKVYTSEPSLTTDDTIVSVSNLSAGLLARYVPNEIEISYTPIAKLLPPMTKITRGPELTYRVKAEVPFSAIKMGLGGVVEVLLLIDSTGKHAKFARHTEDNVDTPLEFLVTAVTKNDSTTWEYYVDTDTLKNNFKYAILKESRKEFNFSEALCKVLPKWEFKPALDNGKAISAFVCIRYKFCKPDEDDCSELIYDWMFSSSK